MRIAVASDHGGFEYKKILIPYVEQLGHTVRDYGCPDGQNCDYSDYAAPACEAVQKGECDRAILVCGTGIGMSIAANKLRGIRCALCGDLLSARLTREHNDTNALAMGGRIIGIETAKAIVDVWLSTGFTGGRHQRRIDKIAALEQSR